MRKRTILAGVVVLAAGNGARAQDISDNGDGAATKLGRIMVTAPLRRSSSLERSTSSVTVIDKKQIEQSAAPDLPSLLADYSGVSITTHGGMGADSSVSLRGTTANQTLVLINGVRAGSATLGTTRLSSIPLESIERIEIAKGAHSAQYGADAIGGVINIITKQGDSCPDGRDSCGSATVGVLNPWGGYLSGNVRGTDRNTGVNYSVGGILLGTEGYDFTLPTTYGHEPDKDGFLQGAVNFSASKDFDWGRLYGDGVFSRSRSQYDRQPADEVDSTTFAGKLGARIDHSDSWFSTIELTSAVDDESNFGHHVKGDDFDTLRYGIFASTQKTFTTGSATHILTGGVEAYRESIGGSSVSDVPYARTQRDLSAIFGQYSFQYKALTIDSGIRYDHDEQFGGATTYNVGASYLLAPGLAVRASYATGFRAPTFNDLYYPDPFTPGNPDLKPEESRSYEVGLNWQAGADTNLDIALYQTKVHNQIDWVPIAPGSFIWHPDNIARVKVTGLETTLTHRFDAQWSGRLSADIRRPIDEETGKYVIDADRFKATAELTYSPTEALSLTTRVHYGRARFADAANTIKLPDYITADLVALYAFDKQSQLKFSVENIFDEQYQTVQGYRAPGRTFDVSLTRTF